MFSYENWESKLQCDLLSAFICTCSGLFVWFQNGISKFATRPKPLSSIGVGMIFWWASQVIDQWWTPIAARRHSVVQLGPCRPWWAWLGEPLAVVLTADAYLLGAAPLLLPCFLQLVRLAYMLVLIWRHWWSCSLGQKRFVLAQVN
jgi:hypothetical protein